MFCIIRVIIPECVPVNATWGLIDCVLLSRFLCSDHRMTMGNAAADRRWRRSRVEMWAHVNKQSWLSNLTGQLFSFFYLLEITTLVPPLTLQITVIVPDRSIAFGFATWLFWRPRRWNIWRFSLAFLSRETLQKNTLLSRKCQWRAAIKVVIMILPVGFEPSLATTRISPLKTHWSSFATCPSRRKRAPSHLLAWKPFNESWIKPSFMRPPPTNKRQLSGSSVMRSVCVRITHWKQTAVCLATEH